MFVAQVHVQENPLLQIVVSIGTSFYETMHKQCDKWYAMIMVAVFLIKHVPFSGWSRMSVSVRVSAL